MIRRIERRAKTTFNKFRRKYWNEYVMIRKIWLILFAILSSTIAFYLAVSAGWLLDLY